MIYILTALCLHFCVCMCLVFVPTHSHTGQHYFHEISAKQIEIFSHVQPADSETSYQDLVLEDFTGATTESDNIDLSGTSEDDPCRTSIIDNTETISTPSPSVCTPDRDERSHRVYQRQLITNFEAALLAHWHSALFPDGTALLQIYFDTPTQVKVLEYTGQQIRDTAIRAAYEASQKHAYNFSGKTLKVFFVKKTRNPKGPLTQSKILTVTVLEDSLESANVQGTNITFTI